jgi:carbon dioxide concentrating mechanism protein CcmL
MAKVLGTVVSTQKEPTLRGSKFLLLQFIDEEGSPVPGYEVAADCVGAGIDEWVLVTRGSAARIAPGSENRPDRCSGSRHYRYCQCRKPRHLQ